MQQGKFQRIAAHVEIDAACVGIVRDGEVKIEAVRGKDSVERWTAIFPLVLGIAVKSGEGIARAIIGRHTVNAAVHKNQCIATVVVTGMPVTKSMRRMLLRQYLGVKPGGILRPPREPTLPRRPLQPRDELDSPFGDEPGSDGGTFGI